MDWSKFFLMIAAVDLVILMVLGIFLWATRSYEDDDEDDEDDEDDDEDESPAVKSKRNMNS